MYLVYLDEAGNTGRNLEDAQEPFHVVASLIVRDRQWKHLEAELNKLTEEKIPQSDRENFAWHAYELFLGQGYFKHWKKATRLAVCEAILQIIPHNGLPIVYGCIDKRELNIRYAYPYDPQGLAFLFCAERVERWFKAKAPSGAGMFIADETKSKLQMKKALREWRESGIPLGMVDERLDHIVETIYFARLHETPGLQLSDFCNFFIKRHIKGKRNAEEFYKIIEPQIHDLRIFPPKALPADDFPPPEE